MLLLPSEAVGTVTYLPLLFLPALNCLVLFSMFCPRNPDITLIKRMIDFDHIVG